jgi:hypothetical protein
MSSITVSSLVLGSLTVEVDGSDSTLALSVLGTAPATLSIELGTPGAQGDAATIAVGTTTTLAPGSSATVANAGTSSAAVFNFGIPAGQTGATGATGATGSPGTAATIAAGTTTTGAPGSSASVTNSGTSGAAVFDFTIPRGDVGATGATGATGPAGPGVAIGGTANQSLLKVDGTNYNTYWGTPPLATLATSSETVIATVRNATGSTLSAGQVVYIDGAIGNRPSVALAQANLEATSAGTYGMVSAPIANNADGTIVIAGFVAGLNTNAFTDGDLLYLSPTVPGGWTTTKPSAPDNLVYIGVITRSHPTLGVIQLRISNGFELAELHDVDAPTPSNSDLLAFETSSNLWKNKSASTLGLATTADSNAAYLAKASNLSDLTNASTARTNLGLGTAAVEPATKLVPAGGTTGQVLAKASATSWDLVWSTAGGGGGITATLYTTPGTYSYTIPSGATQLMIHLWGSGGGGGSGARFPTSSGRSGGSGGSGGSFYFTNIRASVFTSPVTVVVPAGGAGAVAATANSNTGTNGTAGANAQFGDLVALGGLGGNGGNTSGVSGVAQRSGSWGAGVQTGTASGQGAVTTGGSVTVQSPTLHWLPTSGGGGAGMSAGATLTTNGGSGGIKGAAAANQVSGWSVQISGGSGGVPPSTLPTNGVSGLSQYKGGTGAGGGGQSGANGGFPGGGGGGGSASDDGFNSGAGGSGANGMVMILAW